MLTITHANTQRLPDAPAWQLVSRQNKPYQPGKHNSFFDNNNEAFLLIDPKITQNWY